jgi:hypothetical protein
MQSALNDLAGGHSIFPARAGLQDIELARISQEVTERGRRLFEA